MGQEQVAARHRGQEQGQVVARDRGQEQHP